MAKKIPKHQKNGDKKDAAKKKTAPTPETEAENDVENPTAKRRGAKSQYENKVKPYLEDIARYTRCGVTEGQLCAYYGVGKTQWAAYKKNYPELNETLYEAKQIFKTELENAAYKVAYGYEYTEEKTVEEKSPTGKVVSVTTTTQKRYAKPDPAMIQFLLINRFKDEYARDPQVIELRKRALELAEKGKMPLEGGEGL